MVSATRVDPVRPERRSSAGALEFPPVRSLRLFTLTIGCVTAVVGSLVLVGGWGLDIDPLKSVLPGLSTMKPNTALGIAALGAGLALTAVRRRHAAVATSMLALAIGILTIAEYVLEWNGGIDELLFRDTVTPSAAYPGRPAMATAFMMTLLAAGQLFAWRPALQVARTTAAVLAAVIAFATLTGYVFGSQALHAVPLFSSVAVHTAAALLLFALGILAVEPVSWPVRTVLARGTGGTVCRWLLPPAILAPPVLGWVISRAGSSANSYPDAFRWAIYSVTSSMGSVALILLLAHRIALIDAERTAATEMSLHDPLTGLANRRAFDSFLSESFNLSKRHNHPLSLALLDLDGFKSYNDDYGHPAGDDLLKSLGQLLASLARETDLVARIGGEEFAIALPETDLAGARTIAERVRASMERSELFRRRVTVSIGVAALTSETADPAMLVKTCDEALYHAKRAGKNRVSVADELGDRHP